MTCGLKSWTPLSQWGDRKGRYLLHRRAPRIKIVDYPGSKEVAVADIENKLKELNVEVKLDSPLDDAVVRRVAGVSRPSTPTRATSTPP